MKALIGIEIIQTLNQYIVRIRWQDGKYTEYNEQTLTKAIITSVKELMRLS